MTEELLQLIEHNPLAALLVATIVFFFVLWWAVCISGAVKDNPFDPERHCSRCKHRPGPGEPYLNNTCVRCLESEPIHSEWEPKE